MTVEFIKSYGFVEHYDKCRYLTTGLQDLHYTLDGPWPHLYLTYMERPNFEVSRFFALFRTYEIASFDVEYKSGTIIRFVAPWRHKTKAFVRKPILREGLYLSQPALNVDVNIPFESFQVETQEKK
jgi:hypothetical protein